MKHNPYTLLIEVKRWADQGLLDVVSREFEKLSEAERTIMLRVLDHIHTVDRIFQHNLQRLPHAFKAPRSESLPDLATLTAGMREVDDWYESYVRGLSPEDLAESIDFAFTSGKRARMTRGEMLLHVCLHGNYHRGNAGAVLQLKGLTPSRDSVTDYLERAA